MALKLVSFLLIVVLEDNEAIAQMYDPASLTSTLILIVKTDWMLAPSSRSFCFWYSIPVNHVWGGGPCISSIQMGLDAEM
jgi:hypothetical protein